MFSFFITLHTHIYSSWLPHSCLYIIILQFHYHIRIKATAIIANVICNNTLRAITPHLWFFPKCRIPLSCSHMKMQQFLSASHHMQITTHILSLSMPCSVTKCGAKGHGECLKNQTDTFSYCVSGKISKHYQYMGNLSKHKY